MNVSTSSKPLVVSGRSRPGLAISPGGTFCWSWLLALLLVVPARAETIKLVATQNAQIDAAAPDTVFEDWGLLNVFSFIGPSSLRRVLLQFDLSAVPAGASLTSVKLKLFSTADGVNPEAFQEVWRVENDVWSQAAVTWNNFVSGQSNYLAGLGTISGPGYNEWNLDLNAWNTAADLADGKLSVLVKFSTGLEGDYYYRGVLYYSRQVPNPNNSSNGLSDSDLVPYLEIIYTGAPPVIPPPLIKILSSATNQLSLAWNSFPGWSYQLQSNAALGTTNWTACTGTNYASELTMTNIVAMKGNQQNFFRVQQFSR